MIERIQNLGFRGLDFTQRLGKSGKFLLTVLLRWPNWRKAFHLVTEQIYLEGVLSLSIIIVSALFIGMVVSLQGFTTLDKFGAEEELGQLLALSVVRELGPVVTALLFAGRAGSALTAEIALMKTTEQLSAMGMMGVDPLEQIIWPRLWAGFFALPILVLVFNTIAVMGGYMIGVEWLGVDAGTFWSNMQASVDFWLDICGGLKKALAFGFIISWIAVFQGYSCIPNAAGMARATTKTVVYSSLAVLGLDFVMTSMMLGGW
jgi:phospholipid/cholesterol/gamma-HCH transport system permease protein